MGKDFVASAVKSMLDCVLSTNADPTSRAGYALAIGCVLRHVGVMSVSHHLPTTVGILSSLSNDVNPVLHTFALHSLCAVLDVAGLAYQPFTQSTMDLVCRHFFSDTHASPSDSNECVTDTFVSLGKIIASLLATVGPELQQSASLLDTSICLYFELVKHQDPAVITEALKCAQQIALFAPASLPPARLMPDLQRLLLDAPLSLRRVCISCIRQLVQGAPSAVVAAADHIDEQLCTVYDREDDEVNREDISVALGFLLQATGPTSPSAWIALCRAVLTGVATGASAAGAAEAEALGGGDDDDDEQPPTAAPSRAPAPIAAAVNLYTFKGQARSPTKILLVHLLSRLLSLLDRQKEHFDLALARQGRGDLLVLKLADLVRLMFNAATGTIPELRLAGLQLLEDIASRFGASMDPDYEDHSILEQYLAQIMSTLRPAFAADAPPLVTAEACRVAAAYLESGAAVESSDISRVVKLITSVVATSEAGDSAAEPTEGDEQAPSSVFRLKMHISPFEKIIVELASLSASATLYCKPAFAPYLNPYARVIESVLINISVG